MGLICSNNLATASNVTSPTSLALPISNATQYGFRAPARCTTAGASIRVYIDLGSGSQKKPRMAAFLGTNVQGCLLSASVRGGAAVDANTVSSAVTTLMDADGYGNIFVPIVTIPGANYQYWRMDLTFLSGTYPAFTDIGRVWLSEAFDTDFDYDWIPGGKFGTTAQASSRGRVQRITGKKLRTMEINVSNISSDEGIANNNNLMAFLTAAGENAECIICPETALTGSELIRRNRTCVYGRIDADGFRLPRQKGGYYSGSVSVVEIPA